MPFRRKFRSGYIVLIVGLSGCGWKSVTTSACDDCPVRRYQWTARCCVNQKGQWNGPGRRLIPDNDQSAPETTLDKLRSARMVQPFGDVFENASGPAGDWVADFFTSSDGRVIWIVGVDDTLLLSEDAGEHWELIQGPTSTHSPRSVYSPNLFGTADGREIWFVNEHGNLSSYDLNRRSLTPVKNNSFFVRVSGTARGNHMWAQVLNEASSKQVMDPGRRLAPDYPLLYSEDRGLTWDSWSGDKATLHPPRSNFAFLASFDPLEQHLWSIDNFGQIQESTNGGEYWNSLISRRRSVFVVNSVVLRFNPDGKDDYYHRYELPEPDDQLDAPPLSLAGTKPMLGPTVLATNGGSVLWKFGCPQFRFGGTGRPTLFQSTTHGQTWFRQWTANRQLLAVRTAADGRRLYGITSKGEFLTGEYKEDYAAITRARLKPTLTANVTLELDVTGMDPKRDALLVVASAANNPQNRVYRDIPCVWMSGRYTCMFAPSLIELRPWGRVYFVAQIAQDHLDRTIELPSFTLFSTLTDNRVVNVIAAVYSLLLLTFVLLLLIAPLWILRLWRALKMYRWPEVIENKTLALIIKLALSLTVTPLFVCHRRTLDAWVRHHVAELLRYYLPLSGFRFANAKDQLFHTPYVNISAEIGDATKRVTPELFAAQLKNRPILVEIEGKGGTGKSMLAVELGRWVIAGDRNWPYHPMIPVFINGEVKEKLTEKISKSLTSIVQEDIEPLLLAALIRQQRVLVIIDGLSERSAEMQDYVHAIHEEFTACAIVVTTRIPRGFKDRHTLRLRLRPLDFVALAEFVDAVLAPASASAETISSVALSGGVETLGDRSESAKADALADKGELVKHITALFRPAQGAPSATGTLPEFGPGLPVSLDRGPTPLLVHLIIEEALLLRKNNVPLENGLPSSVPDAYFAAIRRVDPAGSIPNLLMIAEELAIMALEPDFVPKGFLRSVAERDLVNKKLTQLDRPSPIDLLISYGCLAEDRAGDDTILYFTFDPVAECLAAMAYTTQKRAWMERLNAIEKSLGRPSDFREALEQASLYVQNRQRKMLAQRRIRREPPKSGAGAHS